MNRDPQPEHRDPTARTATPEDQMPRYLKRCACGKLFRTVNPAWNTCHKCRAKQS